MDLVVITIHFETSFVEVERVCFQKTEFFKKVDVKNTYFVKKFKFWKIKLKLVINFHLRPSLLKSVEDFLKYLTSGTFSSPVAIKIQLSHEFFFRANQNA